jgi:16S rRNA (cytidine1402-2'-O)-methyltransferase
LPADSGITTNIANARGTVPRPAEPSLAAGEATAARAGALLAAELARALPAGLYIVATPIGNLGDISLRALATLARVDVIYCEDTRHSRTLLAHFAITRPLRAYHEHNAERERPRLIGELKAGRSVALISDAGTPLISDPGYKLVREALAAGIKVTSLPGASALTAALTSCGLATDTVLFAGFLPPKQSARRTRLAQLAAYPATLVLFEAPSRLAAALADLAEGLGPREAAICRELTKLYEEVRRGELPALAREIAAGPEPRGEIVIVIAPPAAQGELDAGELDALLRQALDRVSVKEAVAEVTAVTGQSRRAIYQRALELSRERDHGR